MLTPRSNRWTQDILGQIHETDVQSLPNILQQSRQAFTSWSMISVRERILCIAKLLKLYQAQREEIARSVSLEIGKAITHALADVDYDIGYIQWHLDHAESILAPELIHEDEQGRHTAYYEPKGVAVVISPRNYPTSQWVWEVIPPLLAGNTIIYKSASACMQTAKLMSDLLISCLPAGVFQAVYGPSSLGNELTKLPVELIIFTGSTKVGQTIQHNAAQTLAQTHLELGGSAPGIILPGTPITDQMMQTIAYFRIRHAGQICDGLKRLFVHRSQYDELCQKMTAFFSSTKIGDPLDPTTEMGMLISESAKTDIQAAIDQSIAQGAKKLELWHYDGTVWPWMPIVVLTDVTLEMPVMTQEIFGPVLPIMVYESIDEAIQYANATIYGLGGYLRGQDQTQIDSVCRRLHTGNISVNNTSYLIPQVPFGGYKPASGNFREHGKAGLREYTEMKVVSLPGL